MAAPPLLLATRPPTDGKLDTAPVAYALVMPLPAVFELPVPVLFWPISPPEVMPVEVTVPMANESLTSPVLLPTSPPRVLLLLLTFTADTAWEIVPSDRPTTPPAVPPEEVSEPLTYTRWIVPPLEFLPANAPTAPGTVTCTPVSARSSMVPVLLANSP